MTDLPEPYVAAVLRLSAKSWRERKEAVAQIKAAIADDRSRDDVMVPLAQRLIDGLLSPDDLEGRAASHEVLVSMGSYAVGAVLGRLESSDEAPRLLVDLLGELGDPVGVPGCAAILRDASLDSNLRASAASALGRLGGREAADALRGALGAGAQLLGVHVLDALHTMSARVALSDVRDQLDDRFTRKPAVLVLGRSADPEAIGVLVPLLCDDMAGVRAAAAVSLCRLEEDLVEAPGPASDRSSDGSSGRDSADAPLVAALRQATAKTRDCVRALISHPDHTVCVSAIRLAGAMSDTGSVGDVLDAMNDPLIQEHAIAMVSALGTSAGPSLREAAERNPAARREHLLRLLGALDARQLDDDSRTVLAQGLDDADDDTALAAAESLGRVGNRSVLGELYRAIGLPGRRGEAAAEALADILRRYPEDAHADLNLIVGTQWPENGDLARNLCRVVGALRSPRYAGRLVSLLGAADVGVRIAAALAIGQLDGEHEGVPALSFALADEEPQVRAAACRSLGHSPAAVTSLLSATTDASPLVRTAAVGALVALDNPVALARLRAIIAEDPVPSVVVGAISGLGSSGLDQDLTMLMSLCTSGDWEVVKAAARALSSFSAHRATAALLGLLSHARWDVRWTAAEVLEARADVTAVASLRAALGDEHDRLVRDVLHRAIERLEQLA